MFRAILATCGLLLLVLGLSSCDEDIASVREPSVAPATTEENVNARRSDREDRGEGLRVRKKAGSLPDFSTFVFPPAQIDLDQGFETREELFWVALRAIDVGDREVLRDLLVDEEYYLNTMFPAFVVEKPVLEGRGQFHWDHLEMKSLSGILDLVRDYAGRGLEFRWANTESTRSYGPFSLHRHPLVAAYDRKTQREVMLAITNDIVEVDGKFQLLAYPN